MQSSKPSKLATSLDPEASRTAQNMAVSCRASHGGPTAAKTSSRGFESEPTSKPTELKVAVTDVQSASCRRKTSTCLSIRQVENVFAAASFAIHLEMPLNRFVTLAWEHGSVEDPATATQRFLKLVRDALRKHGQETAWVWVHECGPMAGMHVHLLLHVPPTYLKWFNRRCAGWMKRCGAARRAGVRHSRHVGISSDLISGTPEGETYMLNLQRALEYMVKDACLEARKAFSLTRQGDHGVVVGKRCGVSQNTGPKARAANLQ